MAKHDTIHSILTDLRDQQYKARTLVYADSDMGKVEVVINHLIGDNGRTFNGDPEVCFEAFKYKKDTFQATIKPLTFPTLVEALSYIGLPRSDCD